MPGAGERPMETLMYAEQNSEKDTNHREHWDAAELLWILTNVVLSKRCEKSLFRIWPVCSVCFLLLENKNKIFGKSIYEFTVCCYETKPGNQYEQTFEKWRQRVERFTFQPVMVRENLVAYYRHKRKQLKSKSSLMPFHCTVLMKLPNFRVFFALHSIELFLPCQQR